MGFYILSLSRKKERISKQLKEAELREAMSGTSEKTYQ